MPFVIMWALVAPPALALAVWLKRKPEETLPLFFLGSMSVAYIISLFGLLRVTPYALYATCLASCAYLLYTYLYKKAWKIKDMLTPGLVAAFLLSILAWWLCRGVLYTGWDEFSHWGRGLKNMFFLDELYTVPASNDGFKDYPPGLAVLQYTFLKAAGQGFVEALALYVPKFFTMCVLAWPLSKFSWKQSAAPLVGAFLAYFCIVGIFLAFPYETSIDALLAVVLAFVLLVQYKEPKGSAYYIALTCLSYAALGMLKDSGKGLAVLVWLLALADFIKDALAARKTEKKPKQYLLRQVVLLFLPLAVLLLVYFSWEFHLSLADISHKFVPQTNAFVGWAEIFSGTAPAYRYEVIRFYGESMFSIRNYGNWLNFQPVLWLVVYLILGAGTYFATAKEGRSRWMVQVIVLIFGNIAYAFILLHSYLFNFHPQEAVMLASISRYLNTIILATLLFLIISLISAFATTQTRVKQAGVVVLTGLLLVSMFDPTWLTNHIIHASTYAAKTQQYRILSSQSAARIKELGVNNPRVYLIAQKDDGLHSMMLDYELTPEVLPPHQPSIGTTYPEESLWVAPYTVADWEKILYEGFDYVYLFNVDKNFVTEYQSLFENKADITNETMFEVVRNSDKSIVLRKIS